MKNIVMIKKVLTTVFCGFALTAFSQQEEAKKPLFSDNLTLAIKDFRTEAALQDIDFSYYSENYDKTFALSRGFLRDISNEDLADFYNAFNKWRSDTYQDPIIRNMPPPGPNLDYGNVNPCSGGLYDIVISTK